LVILVDVLDDPRLSTALGRSSTVTPVVDHEEGTVFGEVDPGPVGNGFLECCVVLESEDEIAIALDLGQIIGEVFGRDDKLSLAGIQGHID
jgi:hypothetical protein